MWHKKMSFNLGTLSFCIKFFVPLAHDTFSFFKGITFCCPSQELFTHPNYSCDILPHLKKGDQCPIWKLQRTLFQIPWFIPVQLKGNPSTLQVLTRFHFFNAFIATSKQRVGTIVYGQWNYLLKVGYEIIRKTIIKWLNIECF
jgi:hypothetical protein